MKQARWPKTDRPQKPPKHWNPDAQPIMDAVHGTLVQYGWTIVLRDKLSCKYRHPVYTDRSWSVRGIHNGGVGAILSVETATGAWHRQADLHFFSTNSVRIYLKDSKTWLG